jgi:hypothetical protein
MALEDHYQKAYRSWAGNNKGQAPNYSRCCADVADGGRSVLSHQCCNKNGHGPDGAYCKTHDPVSVAKRQMESSKRYYDSVRKSCIGSMGKAISALISIEKGHNDPRALAKEILDEYRKRDWWIDPE